MNVANITAFATPRGVILFDGSGKLGLFHQTLCIRKPTLQAMDWDPSRMTIRTDLDVNT